MRILLVEDEKSLSDALVVILKHNNYSVDAVYNGADALDYLRSADVYDAVILDVMMPKVDGLTMLRTIREEGNKIPVLMLTAKSDVDDKVCGLDSGADDYLTKPFQTKELLARLRSILRRPQRMEESVLSYGDVKLDRISFSLSGPKGSVQLTSKEFQIMENFLANPKNVVSAESFMEKIWGLESETEISVVWTYISYIRKKLAQIGANVTVKAVRNLGYVLEKTNAK